MDQPGQVAEMEQVACPEPAPLDPSATAGELAALEHLEFENPNRNGPLWASEEAVSSKRTRKPSAVMREIAQQKLDEELEAEMPRPAKKHKSLTSPSDAKMIPKPKPKPKQKPTKPRISAASVRKKALASAGLAAYLQDSTVWREACCDCPEANVQGLAAQLQVQWRALSGAERARWEESSSALQSNATVALAECTVPHLHVVVQPSGKGPKHRWRGWVEAPPGSEDVTSALLQHRSAVVHSELTVVDGVVTGSSCPPRSVDVSASKLFVCEGLVWAKTKGFPWWPAATYKLLHPDKCEVFSQFIYTWYALSYLDTDDLYCVWQG